jgi:hypothetical protein
MEEVELSVHVCCDETSFFAVPDGFCDLRAEETEACCCGWMASCALTLLNELSKLWGKHQTSCILVEHLVNGLVEVDEEEHSPRANLTQRDKHSQK